MALANRWLEPRFYPSLPMAGSKPVDYIPGLWVKVLDYLLQLLDSNDHHTQKWTLLLIGQLANREGSVEILKIRPSEQLVLLSNSDDIPMQQSAVYALSMISQWPKGPRAVLYAGALNYASKLLNSADVDTRAWTCAMIGNIAQHELLPLVGLAPELPARLVTLLRRGNDGRRAVVDARVLEYVPQLLDSSDEDTRNRREGPSIFPSARTDAPGLYRLAHPDSEYLTRISTCTMLGQPANHEATRTAVLRLQPIVPLLSILRHALELLVARIILTRASDDPSEPVRASAVFTLSRICRSADGVSAVLAGLLRLVPDPRTPGISAVPYVDVFRYVGALVESTDAETRVNTCLLLVTLARHIQQLRVPCSCGICLRSKASVSGMVQG
ncbi:armadillo-type protein [Mycena polygramma]|nr:armadillo-type protein [Mycena polygramma]